MTLQISALALALLIPSAASGDAKSTSHPPMRPLPMPSSRAQGTGPAYYVEARAGNDTADGSKTAPWKSLAVAVKKLRAGDTLYVRGGTYYESVTMTASGKPGAPITIRSFPGEVAIVDAGFREFVESPSTAWEPVGTPALGEFRSTKTYPLGKLDEQGRGVFVVGNFADSMVPLHGYKFDADLRATNEYWNVKKTEAGNGVYVGPGVWFDPATKRIHARLARTTLKTQINYAGERDPRRIALVVGGDRHALKLENASHVRIQDLTLRGSATHTVELSKSEHIELDGVVVYGGAPALFLRSTNHLRVVRSALRGTAAPWSSRLGMKNRGNSPYLVISDPTLPQSQDWEFAYDELVDGHDGIVLDNVRKVRFHHNHVDNFNDDAIYLTFAPRPAVPDDVQIFENLVTRSYTVLAFAAEQGSTNPIGGGAYIYRNVFDLREPPYVEMPKDAAAEQSFKPINGRMCGDHGGPIWDPVFFYHNTVVTDGAAWRDYYGAQMIVGMRGTKRRLFDNVFVRVDGDPGLYFKGMTDGDLQVDGNLLWGRASGPNVRGDFFAAFRQSPIFIDSKRGYPPGWGASDIYADPKFSKWADRGKGAIDVALQPGSPAIDAGIPIPVSWPDSLRAKDKAKPDMGALPAGVSMFPVGPTAAP